MDHSVDRVVLFMTARNCEQYVEQAIGSAAAQTFAGLHVLFVDDASTDRTADRARRALRSRLPGRHTFISNPQSWGKARNASVHLRRALRTGDVVAVLDADDQLVEGDVVADMVRVYEQGFDVVWTNYCTDQGQVGGNRALDAFSSPRTQGWATSHFFSFRGCLLQDVPEAHFQDGSGAWLTAACDFALAYPVLDQTRRYAYLPRVAYRYTSTNPSSHHNRAADSVGLSSPAQLVAARTVLDKPPLPCTRFATEVPAALDAALSTRLGDVDDRLNALTLVFSQLRSATARAPFHQLAVQRLADLEQVPLAWLRDVGGWALDAEFLEHLRGVLDRYDAPRVLEFGSGRGTKALARLVENRGGTLVSVDHDEQWHAHTTAELERHGLARTASVRLCPLEDVEFYGLTGRFYDMSWLTADDVFDVVVVDGPPTVTSDLARLPALPAVAAHLSPKGFDVFLDDYEREAERKIVEIWRTVAPDLRYETLTFAKEVCSISE